MSDIDAAVVVKPLDPIRVAYCGLPVDGFDVDFAPVFAELYPRLFGALDEQGVERTGPTYGLYDQRDDGRIDVIAAVVIASDAELRGLEVQVRDLPAAGRAATLVHRGSMAMIAPTYALLDRWIEAAGEQPIGFSREVYLECPPGDQSDWITELQFVLA